MKKSVTNLITKMRDNGQTAETIIAALNKKGHTTIRGKSWTKGNLNRVLYRSKTSKRSAIKPAPSIKAPNIDLFKIILNTDSIPNDKKVEMLKVIYQSK